MHENSPVLVTGATGFVGQAIVRELLRRGISVKALARNIEKGKSPPRSSDTNLLLAKGDIGDPSSLAEALRGVSRIIHLVGIISEAGRVTFENIHTRGTANLVNAAESSGVTRLVHMSALGTRPDAVSRYHRTKWEAEECVRSSQMQWTIFRPSLVYGPGDHFLSLFAKVAGFSPFLPVPGTGTAKFAPIHVSQVAAAFVSALDEPRSIGKTFDLCGPDVFTLPEMLSQAMRAIGKNRVTLRIPLPLARLQAAGLELLFGKVLRIPPPLNRDQLIMLEENNTGDSREANDLFSLTHPRFVDGVRACLR